ncbi:hypothetical protein FRB99_001461 [Tulasnella sp. 403]|nr:hypothetical protein FRB99_001461 [Tulasnella sp. 403]
MNPRTKLAFFGDDDDDLSIQVPSSAHLTTSTPLADHVTHLHIGVWGEKSKPLDDQKAKTYNQGVLRKSKREKEKEAEAAKREEEEREAAKAYAEFLDAFDAPDTKTSGFVKTKLPGFVKASDGSGKSQVYEPTVKKDGIPTGPRQRQSEMPDMSVAAPKPKGKRAMDAFLEEIKREQADREARLKNRTQITGSSVTALAAFEGQHGSRDRGDPLTTNVFVANLPKGVTEHSLGMFFARHGPVGSVKIMWPRSDVNPIGPGGDITAHRGKGAGMSGFVSYMTRKSAEECVREMDGFNWGGSVLRVGWSKAVPIAARPAYGIDDPPNEPVTLEEGGIRVRVHVRVHITQGLDPAIDLGGEVLAVIIRVVHGLRRARGQNHGIGIIRLGLLHIAGPDLVRVLPTVPVVVRGRDLMAASGVTGVSRAAPTEAVGNVPARAPAHCRGLGPLPNDDGRKSRKKLTNGPKFGDVLRHRERNNPKFSFLFDNRLPEYHLFRSLSEPGYRCPYADLPFRDDGDNEILSTDSEEEVEKERARKGILGRRAERRFECMLRSLTGRRGEIGRCMAFSLEHADAVGEVVNIIISSLMVESTAVPRKIARLFLICDILHNSAATIPNAWKFRQEFQARLPAVFDHLSDIYHSFPGRITAATFKKQVLSVVEVWEDWIVFPVEFTTELRERLDGTRKDRDGEGSQDGAAMEADEKRLDGDEDGGTDTGLSKWKFKTSTFKPAEDPVYESKDSDDMEIDGDEVDGDEVIDDDDIEGEAIALDGEELVE